MLLSIWGELHTDGRKPQIRLPAPDSRIGQIHESSVNATSTTDEFISVDGRPRLANQKQKEAICSLQCAPPGFPLINPMGIPSGFSCPLSFSPTLLHLPHRFDEAPVLERMSSDTMFMILTMNLWGKIGIADSGIDTTSP